MGETMGSQNLGATQEQLLQADRLAAISQVGHYVAHEINNPLTAVLGLAQMLLHRELDEAVKNDVEVIYREAQRIAGIVEKLLTRTHQPGPEKSSVSVNEALEKTLELRAQGLQMKNIEVVADLQPDLPRTMANFCHLQQLFLNIIDNAERAMAEAHGRGRLEVRTRHTGQAVQITIIDDGPGIPQNNLSLLFDPFFTTREPGKGMGLGLRVCHGIVQEHGGSIRVESEEGKGTRVGVEIPTVAAGSSSPAQR